MGNYDGVMTEFANKISNAHGDLIEVFFIGPRYQSVLHFVDGTFLPAKPITERDLEVLKYAFRNYSYIPPEGQIDPLTLLTFGYSGTGSQCYEVLLRACGFVRANVSGISTGTILKKGGERTSLTEAPVTRIALKGRKGRYFPEEQESNAGPSGNQPENKPGFFRKLFAKKR